MRVKPPAQTLKFGLWLAAGALITASSIAQTGGPYDLSHNVVAGGGSNSTGGNFNISGTIGQSVAGTSSTGGVYNLRGGFWAFGLPGPTAAEVSISGRISTAEGRGIVNVTVSLTGPDGDVRTALTGPFGYYRFEGVLAGETYVMRVTSKRFVFNDPTRVVTVNDELTGIDFTALPLNEARGGASKQ